MSNKAKIKFELDLDSPLGKRVFANLAASFGEVNVTETTFSEVVKDEVTDTAAPVVAEKPQRSSRAKVKPEAEAEVAVETETEEVETPAAEAAKEEAPEENGSPIALGDIKAEIAKKVAKHRDAIKAELTRLGAENSDKLPKEHYPAFHKFLTEL